MESQLRTVIRQKIIDAKAAPLPVLTRRDVWLPAVNGKATAHNRNAAGWQDQPVVADSY